MRILVPLLLILAALVLPAMATAEPIVVREVLIREVAARSNPALEADVIERAMARGDWLPPVAGVADAEGKMWKRVQAEKDGWIRDDALTQGYAYATVTVAADTTLFLEAMG